MIPDRLYASGSTDKDQTIKVGREFGATAFYAAIDNARKAMTMTPNRAFAVDIPFTYSGGVFCLRIIKGKSLHPTVRYLIDHPHVAYTIGEDGLPIITNDEDKVHFTLKMTGAGR